MSSPELSIVIPIRNEAGNIAAVVAEVQAVFDRQAGYEIVLVDDGSDDGSADEIAALVAAAETVRSVSHAAPGGKSRALINGARAARGRFMATMDGDGQDDPTSLLAMWQTLSESGAPDPRLLVCGWRTERRDGFRRRLVSRIANGVRRALLGDGTPDTACGLKLMDRQAFLELPHFENMHRFLPALFARRGYRAVSVPVVHRPRRGGTSKYGTIDRLWAGLWDLIGVMWLMRRMRYPGVREDGG